MSGLDAFRKDLSSLSDEALAQIISDSRRLRRERKPNIDKQKKEKKTKEPQQVNINDLSLNDLDALIASMKGNTNA